MKNLKKKILIVEDNLVIATHLEEILSSSGYEVPKIVTSGEEAVNFFKGYDSDLLLTDIKLSGCLDGIDAVKEIKKMKKIPVIYVTARNDKLTLSRAKETNPAAYLLKPFKRKELLYNIRRALEDYNNDKEDMDIRERYDAIFNRLFDGIFIHDLQGNFIDANDVALKITGYGREEIPGINIATFLDEEQLLNAYSRLENLLKNGFKKESYEYRLKIKDGSFIWVEVKSSLIYKDGAPYAVQGIVRDITEKKRIEDSLREEKIFSDSIINSLPGLFALVDKEGKIVRWNKNLCKISGFNDDEIGSINILDIISEDNREKVSKAYQKASKNGAYSGETHIKSKDGTSTPYYCNGVRVELDGGSYILGTGLDQTVQNNMEKELRKNLLYQNIVNELLSISNMDISLEEQLDMILERIISIPGLSIKKSGAIFLVDYKNSCLVMKASTGLNRVLLNKCSKINLGRCLCGKAALTGQWQVAENIDNRHEINYTGMEPHGHYCIPIFFNDMVIGVLNLYIDEDSRLNEDEENALRAVVNVIGGIIERKIMKERLSASEEQYRELFSNMSSGVAVFNAVDSGMDFSLSNINLSGQEIIKKPLNRIAGKNITEILPGAKNTGLLGAARNVWNTGESENNPRFFYEDKQFSFWMEYFLYKLPTEEIVLVFNDITERVFTEKALKDSEKRYRALFGGAAEGILVADLVSKKFIYANPAICQMMGYTENEIICLGVSDIHPEDKLDFVLSEFEAQARGEKILAEDIPCLRKDGSVIYVNINSAIIEIDGKKCNVGFFTDITESKEAKQKIEEYSKNLEKIIAQKTGELKTALIYAEEERDKVNRILKSAADGLMVTDAANMVLMMNPAAEEILGVRFEDVKNKPVLSATGEVILNDKITETLRNKKKEYEFDFEVQVKNHKTKKILHSITSALKGGKGVVITFHNVTREREIDRMKTDFISTAAHELRTPLTTIRGFSEILLCRNNINEEDTCKYLSYINMQSVKLTNIISDLLDITRIEAGVSFSLSKKMIDIHEVINEVVTIFNESKINHNIKLLIPKKDVFLYADREKIEQVIKNILSNAIKYSPDEYDIVVFCEIFESYYQVSVIDKGIGLTEEQIKNVFNKFYRVDSSDTAPEGTGLGLTIVKLLVEAHGGRVWAESEHGSGTIIRFTLPLNNNWSDF